MLKRFRTPEHRAAERRRAAARRTWVVRQPLRPILLDVLLPEHQAEWVKGMTVRHACTTSEVLRSAVEFASTGRVALRPRRVHPPPRVRHHRTHLTVRQGLYVNDLMVKDGRTRASVMRRLLKNLRKSVDTPVSV